MQLRTLLVQTLYKGFISLSHVLFGLQVESPPMDNSRLLKEKYTAAISRDGSQLTCSWAKMSQQIMSQQMVFLPGHREAAEVNCSPGKCCSDLVTWSHSLSPPLLSGVFSSAHPGVLRNASSGGQSPQQAGKKELSSSETKVCREDLKRQHEHRRKRSTSEG